MQANWRTLAFLLWVLAVCIDVIGSLSPHTSVVMKVVARLPVSDKVLHFSAYVLLAGLATLGLNQTMTALLSAGSMALLGLLLELGQYFVPGRTPEIADELANCLGVVCGIALAFPFRRLRSVLQ